MSARAPALAKLSRPRLPPVARRDRLFRRLDALRDVACVWVCGPAGSGKTTLVSDYVRDRSEPSFWFHVDEGDQDPAAMISYLVALAARVEPDAPPLPYLTPEHRADVARFYRQFFRRFYQILPDACTVVFDNCHRASGDPFHALLTSAIEEAPVGVGLIALSRHQLPIDFAKVLAKRLVGVIGADDLRLDASEARAIVTALRSSMDTTFEAIYQQCDGWVAGLILVLSHTRAGQRGHQTRPGPASQEAIFRYFADELFASAEPALRRLLLRTCLLQTVTPGIACELTGDRHAGAMLEGMYQRHFFTTRRDDGSSSEAAGYSYHDLFRAFLVQRLETDLTPVDLRALRTQVATILEGGGFVADAIEQYRTLESWGDVARIVVAAAQSMIDEGRILTLGAWLRYMPEVIVESDPWLLLFRGHVVAISDPANAVRVFEHAYDRFVAAGDRGGQFGAAFATMEATMVSSASFKSLDRWIDVLGSLLEPHRHDAPEVNIQAWHTFLFTCMYRRPDHHLIPTAVAILDGELFGERLKPAHAIQAATGLLAYAHFSCDEALAARVMVALRGWLDGDDLAVMSQVLGAGWMTVYHFFDARYQEAVHWADKARALALENGFKPQAGIQACYRAQSLAFSGVCDAPDPPAGLPPTGSDDPRRSAPAVYAATSLAIVRFLAGDVSGAIEIGETGLSLWRENGFIMAGLAWAQSMQAVYRMAAGETEAALALVAASESGLAGTVCNYPDALYALLRAEAALRRQDRSAALVHLKVSLAHADNRKRVAVLSWARPFLPVLFALAWQEGIARERVASLIAEWGIAAPAPDEPNWPRAIEIRLLGDFEVRRLGSPIDFGHKPPRRVLALLKAIVLGGERGLSVESARSQVWPDQEGDAAAMSQTAALYRLRKMLGTLEAIRLSEGLLTLDPGSIWVDASAFERLAASADEQDRLRALSIYRGALLAHDEDEPWTTAARLRLRDVFSRLVERAALPLEATDPETAASLYVRGIEAEPLAEASYRGLMRCYARLDRMADVMVVYRRLRQTLSVVLGIEPSVQSERLRRDLLEGP